MKLGVVQLHGLVNQDSREALDLPDAEVSVMGLELLAPSFFCTEDAVLNSGVEEPWASTKADAAAGTS